MNAQAPYGSLVEIPGNPAPAGTIAGILRTRDRVGIRYAVTPSPRATTRGTVILLQGRNEAIEKYFETIGDLTARGYGVVTFDWRGQGGSQRIARDPRKGHVSDFSAYETDLEAVFRDVVLPDCRGPYAILAHSMGGAVAIAAAPNFLNRVDRIVAAAPLVALYGPKPRTDALFYAASVLRWSGLGGVGVHSKTQAGNRWTVTNNPLTGDARRFERNHALMQAAPQFFLGGPTSGWLAAATRLMRRLDDSDTIARLRIPTLILTAGRDRVVSNAAAQRLAWRMRSGHWLDLPGARHELMQEADRHREPFLAAFDAFVGGAMPAA